MSEILNCPSKLTEKQMAEKLISLDEKKTKKTIQDAIAKWGINFVLDVIVDELKMFCKCAEDAEEERILGKVQIKAKAIIAIKSLFDGKDDIHK